MAGPVLPRCEGAAIFLPDTGPYHTIPGERRHNTATVRPNYYHSSTGADSAPVQERDIDRGDQAQNILPATLLLEHH